MLEVHCLIVTLLGLCSAAADTVNKMFPDNPDIELFRQYLRINTTTKVNDLTPAVDFWRNLANEAGVELYKYEYVSGMPVLVMKWPGTNSSLSSIMLNSHMDVVPAVAEEWKYPPFNATLDDEGVIWGRGTQDMKSVSIQYFLALMRLKKKNVSLLRDVYMTLMPDEEMGGPSGMQRFVKSKEFVGMNVGFEMDEGSAWPWPFYGLFYQDKAVWQIRVNCTGVAVHSATFPATKVTATGKCTKVINSLLNFRESQYDISKKNHFKPETYTSVNHNKLNGGTANNVVPSFVSLVYDMRLATSVNTTVFEKQLNQWLSEAGENVTMDFLEKDVQTAATVITDKNPYFVALQSAAKELNIKLHPIVAAGSTDGRYVRLQNIPAFGFSPMAETPTLPHTSNERLNATTFLRGIDIYEALITHLANIPESNTHNLDGKTLTIQNKFCESC